MQSQAVLQAAMHHPMGEGFAAVKENLFWLMSELGEVAHELPKPWRTSQEVHKLRIKEELIDSFQFYINMLNALGITEAEFDELWELAHKKCELRIKMKY